MNSNANCAVNKIIIKMKKILGIICVSLCFMNTSQAQINDGLYELPSQDFYAVVLTNGDLVRFYAFNLNGFFEKSEGSKIGEKYSLTSLSREGTLGSEMTNTALGFSLKDLYCVSYDDDEYCEGLGEFEAISVLEANGPLKAIYRTQWGAEYVIFESNGIAILLDFEAGGPYNSSYIGASTAQIGPDFTIFDIDTVVESEGPSESDPLLNFKIKLENLETLQASYQDVECLSPGKFESCDALVDRFFSKLTRIF
jgi:hypothetical protein